MALVGQDIVDGPNIQVTGEHRGAIDFTLDDGRVIRRIVQAPNAQAWADALIDLPAEVLADVENADAQTDIAADVEITAHKQASAKQRAVAYLRAAWATDQAYEAYLLLDRFNAFRLAQGWTLNNVSAALAAAGLTADEWEDIKTAYLYLSSSGRPATMATAKQIQAVWEAR